MGHTYILLVCKHQHRKITNSVARWFNVLISSGIEGRLRETLLSERHLVMVPTSWVETRDIWQMREVDKALRVGHDQSACDGRRSRSLLVVFEV